MKIENLLSKAAWFELPDFTRHSLRNTIRGDDTIEFLWLADYDGIRDATRGAVAANAIPKGSPHVRGQVRTILHLIGEVGFAVPAYFHLRCADRYPGRRFKGELGHLNKRSYELCAESG